MRSVTMRLIAVQTLVVALSMAALGVLTYNRVSAQLNDSLRVRTEQLLVRLPRNLDGPLWNFEENQVATQVTMELADQDVVAILVRSEGTLVAKHRLPTGEVADYTPEEAAGLASAKDLMRLETPVEHEGQALGTVELYVTRSNIVSALRQELAFTVVSILAVSLVLTVATLLIGRAVVSRPLSRLTEVSDLISHGDLQVGDIATRSRDEVGRLSASFARMVDTLREKSGVLERIASGDLTVDYTSASDKDSLGRSLARMSDSLGAFMARATVAVHHVADSADQVAQTSQALSQGATEQASATQEVTAAVSQISSQARQNAQASTEANSLAKAAVHNAQLGHEQMQNLVTAMSAIDSAAHKITSVVKLIDDIAFQTNLLALNANVEAARAGKYGKGFAVVAEEVRSLAVRSAAAVKDTTGMVQEASQSVAEGATIASTAAHQLQEIVSSASKVADFLSEIASASKEQAQAVDQVARGLEQIDSVTQANSASSEQSASAAQELSWQASELQKLIAYYQVRKELIESASDGTPPAAVGSVSPDPAYT